MGNNRKWNVKERRQVFLVYEMAGEHRWELAKERGWERAGERGGERAGECGREWEWQVEKEACYFSISCNFLYSLVMEQNEKLYL